MYGHISANGDFAITKYPGGVIDISGQLTAIVSWIKSNTTIFKRYNYVRVEPTDTDGYFGASSFDIIWNLSSVNYGWLMLRSDNSKSVLFGRLVSGEAKWDIPVFNSDLTPVVVTDYINLVAGYSLSGDNSMIRSGNVVQLQLTIKKDDNKTWNGGIVANLKKCFPSKIINTVCRTVASQWGYKGTDYLYISEGGSINVGTQSSDNTSAYAIINLTYLTSD